MRRLLLWGLLSASPAWVQTPRLDPPRVVAQGAGIGRARAAFGGTAYLVVWQEDARVNALRLRPGTLEPLDAAPVRLSGAGPAEFPAVAFADGVFLAVWQDFGGGTNYDVRGLLVDARTGRPRGPGLAIAAGPGNQARPAVAAAGKTFLVVWQEDAGAGTHGVRGVRLSTSGEILDALPHLYTGTGNHPAAAGSGAAFAVTWAGADAAAAPSGSVGDRRGSTSAALVDARTGGVAKALGIINAPCAEGGAIAAGGEGGFMSVAAREGFPNPWGWPGPGAVLCSRIQADGATPEAGLKYGTRMSNICARTVPNVVDGARWGKTSLSWDAGEPGGFPGTADGLWPNGWPAVAYDGRDGYLFAWVKGRIAPDRLNLSGYTVWLRALDGRTLAARAPERPAGGSAAYDETWPVLAAGPPGETLLLTLRLQADQPRRLAARRVGTHSP